MAAASGQRQLLVADDMAGLGFWAVLTSMLDRASWVRLGQALPGWPYAGCVRAHIRTYTLRASQQAPSEQAPSPGEATDGDGRAVPALASLSGGEA